MSASRVQGPVLTERQIEERRAAIRRGRHNNRLSGKPCDPAFADMHDMICRGELTHAEAMIVLLDRLKREKPGGYGRPIERTGTMSLADIRKDGRLGGTA